MLAAREALAFIDSSARLEPLAHALHHLLDFLSRLLGAIGQCAHFIGHHRKTSTTFPRPRRFNGRVERQQIGLLGDGANHIQHLTDVLRLIGQRLHQSAGVLHITGPSALIALAVSLTRSCPRCADSLDWRVASEVDTALRATSSTAVVISLTAVAACSISLFCCCRPLSAVEGDGVQFISSRGQLRR